MRAAVSKANRSPADWPIPKVTLQKGLRYFVMLTVIGIVAIFYFTSTEETFLAIRQLNIGIIFLAALLQIADIWLGGYRNHILLRKVKPDLNPWLTFKAQLANEFGAAVTPGQSGGLPAWLFTLKKGGIAPAQAMASSIIVFLSTLFFFQFSTSISWFALGDRFDSTVFSYLLKYGFIVCSAMFLTVLLSIWMPANLRRRLNTFAANLLVSDRNWKVCCAKGICGIVAGIEQYQTSIKQFLKRDRKSVVQAFAVTSLYYFGKLNLAYLIMLGMGVEVRYLTAMAVLALLRFVLYFSPTPGGSGSGEISITALMSIIMPQYMLPVYAILYRAFHLYLPAAFGAWVVFSELRSNTAKQSGYKRPVRITTLQNQTAEV